MAEGPSRPISPDEQEARVRKLEQPPASSVSAKKKEVGKLPTRIEDEPEEFWKNLSPEEKRAMMTRHRSAAQLKRYGEVVEKGRLRVTESQIGRARKEMEKELAERKERKERRVRKMEARRKWEDGWASWAEAPVEAVPVEVEAEVVEAPGAEEEGGAVEVSEEEVREAAVVEKLGLREGFKSAVGRFVEGVNDVFERWAPKVKKLAEKAGKLGAVVKWSIVAFVDGPLWLVRDWRLKAKTKEVEKYEEEVKQDEGVYKEIEEALKEDVEQRIKVAEGSLIAQLRLLKEDTDTAGREIKEGYAAKISDSNSKAERRLRKNQREADLHALGARRHARIRRVQAEVYRYEAEILEEYDRTLEGYLTRYIASVDYLAGRLHSAVEAKEKWEERAERSREKVRRLNAAVEELSR